MKGLWWLGAPVGNKDQPKQRQQDVPYNAKRTTTTGQLSSPLAHKAACILTWVIASLVVDLSLSLLASFSLGVALLFLPSKVMLG
jgi:hypothetical protein